MEKTIDTKHLEKCIEAQVKAIERHTETMKQMEKALAALIRQTERLTNTISTNNELRRHGGTA